MNADQQTEVLNRLKSAKSLEAMGLGTVDGRTDLRGLVIPDPLVIDKRQLKWFQAAKVSGQTWFTNLSLEGLDFSGSYLKGLFFSGCQVKDCVFDKSNCENSLIWETVFSECSFRKADLRGAGLGLVPKKKRNQFEGVDFTEADLRSTLYSPPGAEFHDCTFRKARLSKLDFGGSVFETCVFEGKLEDLQFYRTGFRAEGFPPNEMNNVDFSQAELRFVEFRGLNLTNVRWPNSEEHLLVNDYGAVLEYLLDNLKGRSDLASRKFIAVLGNDRKWMGAHQKQGIFNMRDLTEIGGEDGARMLTHMIQNYVQG